MVNVYRKRATAERRRRSDEVTVYSNRKGGWVNKKVRRKRVVRWRW